MSDTEDTLREQISKLLSLNMPIHPEHQIDKRNILNNLMHLIEQDRVERDIDSRIDELTTLWPQFTDIKLNGTNGPEDDPAARNRVDARLAELKKQRKEKAE